MEVCGILYIIGQLPHLIVNNNTVTKVSKSFIDTTEYSEEELLNKNVKELLYILRFGPNIDKENIAEYKDYFLFTK